MRTYYIYRHIRTDNNTVFYIGKGTVPENIKYNTEKHYYWRAFEKIKSRNAYWKNIINKTDYIIEIMFESDNLEIIQKKEIEFIKLYKDTLCNLTEGGEGDTYIHSKDTRKRISNSLKGRKRPLSVIEKINKAKFRPICLFENNKWIEFESYKSVIEYLGLPKNSGGNIKRCAKGITKFAYGYQFSFKTIEL
jgi:hypothetical protein